MADHVWMSNAETGGLWECPTGYVPVAESRGWVVTDAPADDLSDLFDDAAPAPDPQPVPEQTGFDPSEHTVDEVNDYLLSVPEDCPGEVERVLELERADKDRKTVHDPRSDVDAPSDVVSGD